MEVSGPRTGPSSSVVRSVRGSHLNFDARPMAHQLARKWILRGSLVMASPERSEGEAIQVVDAPSGLLRRLRRLAMTMAWTPALAAAVQLSNSRARSRDDLPLSRHAHTCCGHQRLTAAPRSKAWMAGTSPAMDDVISRCITHPRHRQFPLMPMRGTERRKALDFSRLAAWCTLRSVHSPSGAPSRRFTEAFASAGPGPRLRTQSRSFAPSSQLLAHGSR